MNRGDVIASAAGAALLFVVAGLATPAGGEALASLTQPSSYGTPEKLQSDNLKKLLEETALKDTLDFFKKKTTNPKDWHKDWDLLSPEDEGYEEDYEPEGMPEVPLQCAESDECKDCFEPAYERLRNVRIRFEKLRRIYAWTKAYKERAFALGDSASGIHGLAGLAWVGERVKLERTYKQFEASYDRKYEELLHELRASLEQIAACEEDVYGEKGWYNRFGFIYYQFMADRYRRS